MKKPRVALDYLNKAIEIEKNYSMTHPMYFKISDSILNKCVILSELKKHEDALNAARMAIEYLHKEFMIDDVEPNLLFNLDLLANAENAHRDRLHVFSIAFLNYATQLEYLNRQVCLLYYEFAHRIISILAKQGVAIGMEKTFKAIWYQSKRKWGSKIANHTPVRNKRKLPDFQLNTSRISFK